MANEPEEHACRENSLRDDIKKIRFRNYFIHIKGMADEPQQLAEHPQQIHKEPPKSTAQRRRYSTTRLGKSAMASVPGRFSFNIPDVADFDRKSVDFLRCDMACTLNIQDERKREEQLLKQPRPKAHLELDTPSLVLRGNEYESDPEMEEVD